MQCYANSATFKHKALDDALGKARDKSKYWEWKAKKGTERATTTEKERDKAKEEARVARLDAAVADDTKARVKVNLARIQDALAVVEEAMCKEKAEVARLEVEKRHSCWKSERLRTRCLLFTPRMARTRKPWRRTTKRPWS